MRLMFLCILLGYLLAFSVTTLLLKYFRFYAIKKGLLDKPNHRSSHITPTPRGGGIIFVFTTALFWLILLAWMQNYWRNALVFLPVSLVAAIGYCDDKFNLSPYWRFLVQVIATIMSLVLMGGFNTIIIVGETMQLAWLGTIFAFLFIIWSLNLFNFMDGIDGIAAVEAVFVLGIGGILLWLSGGHQIALLIWGLIACLFGFLIWNWPVAKIFMGDAGSGFLGFIIAIVALIAQKWYGISMLVWIILYNLFVVDASLTLIRRILKGERWYEAHRLHAYQRLHQLGWSHLNILSGVILLNCILTGLAVLAFCYPRLELLFLAMAFTIVVPVYLYIEQRNPMYPSS